MFALPPEVWAQAAPLGLPDARQAESSASGTGPGERGAPSREGGWSERGAFLGSEPQARLPSLLQVGRPWVEGDAGGHPPQGTCPGPRE